MACNKQLLNGVRYTLILEACYQNKDGSSTIEVGLYIK